MVKQIDAAGIPAVHISTITPISYSVGANRLVPGISIPHPTGQPGLPREEERALRKKLVKRALEALATEIEEQTIFKVE